MMMVFGTNYIPMSFTPIDKVQGHCVNKLISVMFCSHSNVHSDNNKTKSNDISNCINRTMAVRVFPKTKQIMNEMKMLTFLLLPNQGHTNILLMVFD